MQTLGFQDISNSKLIVQHVLYMMPVLYVNTIKVDRGT